MDIGGTPGSASLNGLVWHDVNFNKICDSNERDLVGWTVQVFRNSQLLKSVLTDTSGAYGFSGLAPTTSVAADRYVVLELNGAVEFDEHYSLAGGDVFADAACALGLTPGPART